MEAIADVGYSVKSRVKSFISAFCPTLLASLREFEIARVTSPDHDILDENSRLAISGNFLFDYLRRVETTSIAGEGIYVPQTGEIVTFLRMSSTNEVLVTDVWRDGFLFYTEDEALIAVARAETILNIPFGSLLANVVKGSDGILQVYITEKGIRFRIESGDAFYITEASNVIVAYNPMGQSDFPVLPSFGGSGSA